MGHHSGGKFKIKDLDTYHGKSLREAQTFILNAERRFRIDRGRQFRTDANKVDYCVLAFRRDPTRKWNAYESRAGPERTS